MAQAGVKGLPVEGTRPAVHPDLLVTVPQGNDHVVQLQLLSLERPVEADTMARLINGIACAIQDFQVSVPVGQQFQIDHPPIAFCQIREGFAVVIR